MRCIIFILFLAQYQIRVSGSDWFNRTIRLDFDVNINREDFHAQDAQYDFSEQSPKIVTGGINASNGQYPWTILTQSRNSGERIFGSGTIISDRYFVSDLLSTGQGIIVPPPNVMAIYVGSALFEGFRPPSVYIVRHCWYIAPAPDNSPNIVLCRIHEPLTFNPNIQPIRLPYATNANFSYEAWSSLIVGYGYEMRVSVDRLQVIQSNIFNNNQCNFFDSIDDHEMCGLVGNDPTDNGSMYRYSAFTGGPWMVYEYAPDLDLHPVLIGIHHYQYANQTGSYGRATRVSHFLEWITTLSGGLLK